MKFILRRVEDICAENVLRVKKNYDEISFEL